MRHRVPILLAAICALVFVLGLVQLVRFRFERGDIYPPYSSLRADPLGTMALYESLERMPALSVRRDFSSNNRLPEGKGTTYLHLAADPYDWESMPSELVDEIEGFMVRGGRLVIACKPATGRPYRFGRHQDVVPPAEETDVRQDEPSQPEARKKPGPPEGGGLSPETVDLQDRWGFEFGYLQLPENGEGTVSAVEVVNPAEPALPRALNWRSATLFTNLNDEWRILYLRGDQAVMMERRFGSGSLVLAADAFFLSNEALWIDRHADLLAWLVGNNPEIVFDEAHLGILQQSGVATLMRQYRLHGLGAGLLLLVLLFVWKNAFSLVPPDPSKAASGFVSGRDSASAFVNLLRRNIPPANLLHVCYEQWERTAGPGGTLSARRADQVREILAAEESRPARDRDPLATYRKMADALKLRALP